MTRLTSDMIGGVPYSLADRDVKLTKGVGKDLKGLAFEAVGLDPHNLVMEDLLIASVPVTAGQSIISGFSESVSAVAEHLGARSFVTGRTDVSGFYDAISAGADIVFMADDQEFVAFNVRAGKAVDNVRSTALGYFTALRLAVGSLDGREVLLIGAGRVGSRAADLLDVAGARVTVVDKDRERIESLLRTHRSFNYENDLEAAIRRSSLIYNASPARIPGEWVKEGAIVVSPGMPYSFDEEGERKIAILVHDPLQIGVAVMAVWSASLSLEKTSFPHHVRAEMEVIS